MKSVLALAALLTSTVSAIPLIDYAPAPAFLQENSPVGKQTFGGLTTPAAYASTLNTGAGPTNYGNINEGTGMMPSQVTHYGVELQPDHENIHPVVISTTAKGAKFQLTTAEKADDLINVGADVGKLNYEREDGLPSKYAVDAANGEEDEDETDPAKWGWGWGWGWRGYRHPWGGWRWRRHRYWYM